jgi:hypothetical protein
MLASAMRIFIAAALFFAASVNCSAQPQADGKIEQFLINGKSS